MSDRFEIISRLISDEMAKPYVPGKSDCFFFGIRVADALDATLELEKTYAGAYRTLAGAQRALRRRGHASLVGLFAGHLPACPAAQARPGDIGIILLEDGEHVGVCVGEKFVTKTDRGQSLHPINRVIGAFRAG